MQGHHGVDGDQQDQDQAADPDGDGELAAVIDEKVTPPERRLTRVFNFGDI
jgi:hypothetical protein